MPRRDTKLEAAGAEFLVLGRLLIERIVAFKAYVNFPGYDIIATNAEKNLSCRIQVKSRWQTNFGGGFLIDNFECDFVVLVALNRGRIDRKRQVIDATSTAPSFWVFPVNVARAAQSPNSKWGKAFLRNIDNPEQYLENWSLIKDFLQMDASA